MLLNTGNVDVESKDRLGQTPLSCAKARYEKAIVQLLLNASKTETRATDDIETDDIDTGAIQTDLSEIDWDSE
jgi:hypothetical protein